MNMKNCKVIIGANFGDEGKGLMTDYICSKNKNPIVIRFNSSAQAGHTVTTKEGKRHIFGHFGSGSLLNIPTYLSKYFSVSPLLFIKEYEELKNKDIIPKVYIDINCPIIIPYDMIFNQLLEKERGINKHGSCGIGYDESIQRNSIKDYELTCKDLISGQYIEKLRKIKNEYVIKRYKELNLKSNNNLINLLYSDDFLYDFIQDIKDKFLPNVIFSNIIEIFNNYDNFIFEGAQGLMLSEDYKYFPHVTHSKTGSINVLNLLKDNNLFNYFNFEFIYVTRCYFTRHGAGPLPNELKEKPYANIIDETNIPNDFQDAIRFAYLNLDILNENIENDFKKVKENIPISIFNERVSKSLAITCINQANNDHYYYKDGKLINSNDEKFIKDLESYFSMDKYYISTNPTRENIKIHFKKGVNYVK